MKAMILPSITYLEVNSEPLVMTNMTVPEAFTYKIPEIFTDSQAAPLLCAGAVGYRSVSVANVTRGDVKEFLDIASKIPIIPEVQEYRLEEANVALTELKKRKIRGAKVLVIS